MDNKELAEKLKEIIDEFGGLEGYSKTLFQKIPTDRTLEEELDYLRVCVKYMAFDSEATKKENNYLRKLIEESS